jgi:uncharacterized protein YbaP (TraB family)
VVYILQLLLYFQAFSQNTEFEKTLLWEVSGNGLTKPSFIYGTIHTIEKKEFFLTRSTIFAFNSCKILATEQALGLSQHLSTGAYEKLEKEKYLPKGKTIAYYLPQAEYNFLTEYARKRQVSKRNYKALIRLKPSYIFGYFASPMFGKTIGYEEAFIKQALQRKKLKNYMIIEGLEDYKKTKVAGDSLDLNEEAKDMITAIRNNFEEYKNVVRLYKAQDIETMHQMSVRNQKQYQILVIDRNLDWMPKLEKLMRFQPTFIAVGAAHLAGEYGLLNLLLEKGYVVKLVINNSTVNSFSN